MSRIVISVVFVLTLALTAMGQNPLPVQRESTTRLTDARFEIFQSDVSMIGTLRLDRVTGNVDQLVSSKSGNLVWAKMRVLPHPQALNMTKPHYEIVVVGLPSQVLLLLDTESGATWQLNSKENVSVWQPIE